MTIRLKFDGRECRFINKIYVKKRSLGFMLMKMAEGTDINVNYCILEFSPCKRSWKKEDKGSWKKEDKGGWKKEDKRSSLGKVESSDFIFQSSVCCVEIKPGWEANNERNIKLFMKSKPTLSPNFYATVSVLVGENTISYPKEKILDLNRFIWYGSLGEIRKKLPDIDKKDMKFRLIFETHLESNYGQKSSGHKLVQTSPCLNDAYSLESFSDDFLRLLDHDTMYDVQLKCRDYVIKAHKPILRVRSKYFDNKLQSSTKDKLEIQMDPAAFQETIRYIYTGKSPEFSFELAKNIYKSDISDTGCLREECIEFLSNNLTIYNACECLSFAADDVLKERVVTFIINEKIHLADEFWKPFCENHPKPAIDLLNKVVRMKQRSSSIGVEY